MTRGDAALALGIGAVTLLSRLPFMTRELWAWDSVLYARALESGFHVGVDLDEQRPHPPGYIFYVALAALVRSAGADTNTALVLVSVAASALAAAAIYLLARRFATRGVAAISALAYAANPLVWTYAEVAYPYAVLGALAVALASLFVWARTQSGLAPSYLASFAFGVLSGVRQDLLLLLGVLWIWMALRRPLRDAAPLALAVGAGIVLWLVPTALLSGGLAAYLAALTAQTGFVSTTYSVTAQGADALSYNLRFTVYALAWGLLGCGVLLVGLLLAPALRWLRAREGAPDLRADGPAAFFTAWLAPGLLVYVLVHIGEWGYVLSVLPGLYVLLAALLMPVVTQLHGAARQGARAIAVALVLVPALVFVLSGQRFSAAALAQHDAALRARVSYVKANFAPERTIVLAREDFLLVRYYLPRYRAWLYDPQPHSADAGKKKRPMRATAIVIFTHGLLPRQELDVRYIDVARGVRLAYVAVEPGSVLEFYRDRYTVREPQ